MGLGPVHAIPLAEARKRAAECRRMRLDGIDPIEARSAQRDQKKLEAAKAMTFDACAAAYIDAPQERLAEREAPGPVAQHAEQLCGPGLRLLAGASGRCRAGDEGSGADLADAKAGDGEPAEGADRSGPRLGYRARVTGRAKTRRGGAAISTSCSRRAARSARSSTTRRCPMTSSPISSRR